MRVTQKDNGSFHVTSADDKDNYVVDITENGGHGACSCPDFRVRCQSKLDRGAKGILYGNLDRTCCKHLTAVVQFLGQSVAARLAKKQRTEIWRDAL